MYTIYIYIFETYLYYIYRYLYTNRFAAMIYTQRYKTTTCLVSKSQCLPFWHVFLVPRSKVASCPSNNTDALQGLQVDLPFLGQRGWSRNRNEVAEWNPSFVEGEFSGRISLNWGEPYRCSVKMLPKTSHGLCTGWFAHNLTGLLPLFFRSSCTVVGRIVHHISGT